MAFRQNGGQKTAEQPARQEKRAPDVTWTYAASGGGLIEASVWVNEVTKDDKTTFKAYTTRIQRSYRVEKNGKVEIENTTSLRAGDLLVASFALQECFRWIQDQRNGSSDDF